ncbi:NUDIX hydrolase [Jiangella mangrovi]|uniref:8-oxo-dGTP diphosphatase n=1 Tax=Jiangella mangrovi TaxID=1524084 RepID=A0A7W9GQ12_9ACTN|nr:NUDIX domain-containing protein [Jiangella mangrovi]MBB5787938.1 8-oxo-dGTP diphosphatase [Jiangella mangrovi]
MARRDPVLAAGTVLWRNQEDAPEGRVEICLVHRPKYDDWSLPKGKLDDGEHIMTCAVREVFEETGHRVTLGRPLPSQHYVATGRPKVVRYWLAEADPHPVPRLPDHEVDDVVFLPAGEAVRRLSYERDAELVRTALRGPLRTTPLVLLRHAHAVHRTDWTGPDIERPLSAEGTADLGPLGEALSTLGLRRVLSSDSVRCAETVRPFARKQGLVVELEPHLSEESLRAGDGRHPAVAILRTLLRDDAALVCSHRPILPMLFEAAGVDPGDGLEPGGFAVLHHEHGHVTAVERHLPQGAGPPPVIDL